MYHYLLWFELLSFMVAIICFRYLRGSNLILFIPFLFLTNIQEWGSHYGILSDVDGDNTVSLNIFTSIEFIFYTWLFSREVENPGLKKAIIVSGVILCISIILNLIFFQGIYVFHLYTYLFGSILMVIFACLYFFNILMRDEYVNLIKLPMFWVCVGLLLFYTGMFSTYMFIMKSTRPKGYNYQQLYIILSNIFNIILYSCFIITFLCQRLRKATS